MPTIEPITGQEIRCTGAPGELNLPRTTLMLKWRRGDRWRNNHKCPERYLKSKKAQNVLAVVDYFRIILKFIYCYLKILIFKIFVETPGENIKESRIFGKANGDFSIISCM